MNSINKKRVCPICNSNHLLEEIYLDTKFNLITSNYKQVKFSKQFLKCKKKKFILTKKNIPWVKNIKKIYNNYTFNFPVIKNRQTRESLFSKLIFKNIDYNSNILEIGPGNGNLIKELNNLKKVNHIDAFEINDKNLKDYKKNNKFRKLYSNLNIKIKYDLIILNHSFFHILELFKVTKKIKLLLNKKGKIFLATPNVNNFHVLPYIYEVFSFSSERNIISYFSDFNFKVFKKFNLIEKEIILLFIFGNKKIIKDDNFFKRFTKNQSKFSKFLTSLKKKKLGIHGLGILGHFLINNFKNQIIYIKDDFLNIHKRKKIKLNNNKIKVIKTYKPLKL